MTEQRPLPYWVLWDVLFNLIPVQGTYINQLLSIKTVLSSHFRKKKSLVDWVALSPRLEFNPGRTGEL